MCAEVESQALRFCSYLEKVFFRLAWWTGVPTSTLSRNRKHCFPRVKRNTSQNVPILCRYDTKCTLVRNQYRLGTCFPRKYHVKMHMQPMSNQMDRTIDFGRVFVAILLPIRAPFGIDLGSIEINLGSIGPHLCLT